MAYIEKVLIWSGWLRLSHAAVGGATLTLLATGWLIAHAPTLAEQAADYHYLAAGVLVFGLGLRAFLMFWGGRVERLDQLMPDDKEWGAVAETARFYLGMGKAPLPRWYAHNPLWKPLYLLLYLLLLVLVLSGWLRADHSLILGVYLPDVHAIFAAAVGWWTLLHLIAVVLHDYRGGTTDVSAIINGYRHFNIERDAHAGAPKVETAVRIKDIGP